MSAARVLEQRWPAGSEQAVAARLPRRDVLVEQSGGEPPASPGNVDDAPTALHFAQQFGPFTHYVRTVTHDGAVTIERIEYRINIPYFGWLYRRLIERAMRNPRQVSSAPDPAGDRPSRRWWLPPEQLDARQVHFIGLLAAAGLIAAFTNTVFTQTVGFAADTFGVGEKGQGDAGSIVRLGAVIVIPFALLADRVGRRRILLLTAWLAPAICALGALAPNFGLLTASQTIGRPLGLALSVMIGIVLAEEMPAGSRAFAVSMVTMAAGLGASVAVVPLFLADVFDEGWRLIYVLALLFWIIARRLTRELPETRRFEIAHGDDHHQPAPRTPRRTLALRLLIIGGVATLGNVFVAPASFFQNRYLEDVRGMSGGQIAMFTLITATPGGLGLLAGGKLAERGRRIIVITLLPIATMALVLSYATGGALMWLGALVGAVLGGIVYPAMIVYRGEMFSTGTRSGINGVITFLALLGGVVGLQITGRLVDNYGWSYGEVMLMLSIGQFLAALVVFVAYPETARAELETLNPEDRNASTGASH
jgi:MFS family permease